MAGSTDPILLEYGLSEEDVRLDITKFSDHIVNKKLPCQQTKLRHDLASQMVEKAGGMFLWVKMQEPQLEDYKSKAVLRKVISKMPKGLFQTYERTWKEIRNLSEDDQERAIAILRWAVFAFRPLTVSELTEALLIDADMESEDLDLDDNLFITEEYINRGIKRNDEVFEALLSWGVDLNVKADDFSNSEQIPHFSWKTITYLQHCSPLFTKSSPT
ncbi:hypothetical protein SLS56_002274 [Neofusicoccum ribis]|uniref:Ankyrin repeat protein n=1 Tax=Neofusicoccum ribis TaxID=45134 RepID=A0ABR3T4R6_9PEZI